MEYVFDLYRGKCRVMTTTNFDEINENDCTDPNYVLAHSGESTIRLDTADKWLGFKEAIDRSIWFKAKQPTDVAKKDAINPSHYQGLIEVPGVVSLQWLEHLQYHAHYRNNPEGFKLALAMQVRKYLDRCGGKDAELQELTKALWYMKFLVAFIKNGNKPIFVKDVEEILARKA